MHLELQQWTGLSSLMLIYAFFAIGVAAYVRGYSGFGFSALTVTSLALILPPSEIIHTAYILEIIASIHMLPLVWRFIDSKILSWLVLGVIFGTPFGTKFLLEISQEMMRITISGIVLSASLLIWKNIKFSISANWYSLIALGFFSGFINGASAIGGLPIVLFFLSIPLESVVRRATIIAYLFISDLYAFMIPINQQLITSDLLARSVFLMIPLSFGIYLGHVSFIKTSPKSFQKFTLILLFFLCISVIIQTVVI